MSNIVIFRSADGKTGYRQAESVEESARFVERLRNGEGVEEAKIYELTEVTFEYKPYFRVEVAGSVAPSSASEASSEVASEPESTPEAPATVVAPGSTSSSALDEIPLPKPVEVDAKRGLFSR